MIELSIICAVYNTEKYLEECMYSILNQSTSNFEIIIIDDCSTDNSLSICERIKSENRTIPITILRNEINMGVSASWERGVKEAKGEWVFIIDSDDIIHPNLIEIFSDKRNEFDDNEIDIIRAGVVFANNEEIKNVNWPEVSLDDVKMWKGYTLSQKEEQLNGLNIGKNFIRKRVIEEIDYSIYKEKWPRRFFNDGLFSTIMFKQSKGIGQVQKTTYIHRVHELSTGRSISNYKHLLDWCCSDLEMIKLLSEWGDKPLLYKDIIGYLHQIMRLFYCMKNQKKMDLNIVNEIKRQYSEKYNIYRRNKDSVRIQRIRKVNMFVFRVNMNLWYYTIGKFWFIFGQKLSTRRKYVHRGIE